MTKQSIISNWQNQVITHTLCTRQRRLPKDHTHPQVTAYWGSPTWSTGWPHEHGLFVPWTIRTLDCSYRGLFVPSWTVRTMDCSYRPWTVRTYLDCSYRGLFVPSWTVRTMDCSYRPWTFCTLDYSYRGLFVPSWTVRTMDYSYHHWTIRSMLRKAT